MSVEADFGITDWVFQASGSELSRDITWPGCSMMPVSPP
jgi:hypothetical protein